MKKFTVLLVSLLFLVLPKISQANPIDCAISYMSSLSSSTYGCVSCPSNPICTTITYANVGKTCGPTALAQAQALLPGGWNSTATTAVQNSCGVGNKIGIWIKTGTQTTEVRQCDSANNQPLNYQFTKTTYNYVVWCTATECNCDPAPPKCYVITGAVSCALNDIENNILAFEYSECDCETKMQTGGGVVCGDSAAWTAGEQGSPDYYYVAYLSNACNLTQADIDARCSEVGTSGVCTPPDTDGDGVPDADDFCETPPEEVENVDSIGCTLQGGGDDDGDGVPNEFDNCVTPPGAIVDAFGCQVQFDSDQDTDGDGTPDEYDECPGIAGNGANGCEIDNPQKDSDGDGIPDSEDTDVPGDGDNDGAMLKGVVDWLNRVNKSVQEGNGKLDGLGDTLDEIKDSLDTSGIDTTITDNTSDYDTNLPEDFEQKLTYDDLDKEDPSLLDSIFNDLDAQTAPVRNAILGTTLQASGNCSISANVSVFGTSKTIDFSICDYDLSGWRVIILSITALSCFLIVVRRS